MDRRLAKSRYLGGRLLDRRHRRLSMAALWKNQGIDWNEHPHLKGWFDEIGARPAVQRGVEVLAMQRKPLVDDRAREVLFGEAQYRRHTSRS
jgi:GST-like protein